jgi:hypothetical protein
MSCSTHESNLFHFDRFEIAGLECDSIVGYWIIFFFAVGLQIGRNFIWAKSSQRNREALQFPKDSEERNKIINELLLYTVLSYIGHIISFLLIVGANVGYWIAILIGNLGGTYYSLHRQDKDKKENSSMALEMQEMSSLLEKFEDSSVDNGDYEKMKKFRKVLIRFLKDSEEYKNLKLDF